MNLPEIVSTLVAKRVGDEVQLRWTTPGKTTDDLDVSGPMNAVICRKVSEAPEQACVTTLRVPVAAGLSDAVDRLPPTLAAGPSSIMEYRVEILNARGRSAGVSNPAAAASGAAPSALQRLRGEASKEGAVLTWQAEGTDDAIELHRTAATPIKTPAQPAPGTKRNEVSDVILNVPPGDGAVDRTARMGERYVYTAQRVRQVQLANRGLEVRSLVSAPLTLEMRDIFPPLRPSGLEAVASADGVDLSWEPNTETDLAGYFVLRQEADTSTQLNDEPVSGPSLQDKTATPGNTYRYSIIAVDQAGNRSPASLQTQISVHTEVP